MLTVKIRNRKRKWIIVPCLMLISILFMYTVTYAMEDGENAPEDNEVREFALNDIYFDTVVSIRFDAGENGDELLEGCRSICEKVQQTFSRTDEGSELYAVNHRDADRVEVSKQLAEVVQTGLDYYDISGGRFDITIAPLTDLWDFRSEEPAVPPEAGIQSALRKIGGSAVHVEYEDAGDAGGAEKPKEIRKAGAGEEVRNAAAGAYLTFDSPDTMIDLGALAKGYAADRIAEYLKENGVTSGLINLGGNVLAVGAKKDGSPWKVGIQKPFDSDVADVVEITDQSVVTSGVYERCFERDGVLYHHILDPGTGYPVKNGLWGVTIISDSSLTGDALSTVCLLMGQDEAADLIRRTKGVRAIFIDDQLHVTEIG